MNFKFPIESDWSTAEIIKVVECLDLVEKAYHHGIDQTVFLEKYRAFKSVIPSKGEEKRIGLAFEKETGYSLYLLVQKVNAAKNKTEKIKMG